MAPARSKNYRWSCNAQVLVRRRNLRVVEVSGGGPGNRNDPIHYRGSPIEALCRQHGRVPADGGYRGTHELLAPVFQRNRILRDEDWRRHRKRRARVEHAPARRNDWRILPSPTRSLPLADSGGSGIPSNLRIVMREQLRDSSLVETGTPSTAKTVAHFVLIPSTPVCFHDLRSFPPRRTTRPMVAWRTGPGAPGMGRLDLRVHTPPRPFARLYAGARKASRGGDGRAPGRGAAREGELCSSSSWQPAAPARSHWSLISRSLCWSSRTVRENSSIPCLRDTSSSPP